MACSELGSPPYIFVSLPRDTGFRSLEAVPQATMSGVTGLLGGLQRGPNPWTPRALGWLRVAALRERAKIYGRVFVQLRDVKWRLQ